MAAAPPVKGGAGKFTITLPDQGGYKVGVTAGLGETVLLIPENVEARIEVTSGLSNIEVADARFKETANNVWETPGYQSATDQVRISITAGVGQVRIDQP